MNTHILAGFRMIKFVPLLFCLFLAPLQALGWGALGHRAVGEIAASRFTPEARVLADKLLGGKSLADVASWADEIRGGGAYAGSIWYHFEKIPDGVGYLDNLRALDSRQRQKGGVVAVILVADHLLDKAAHEGHRAGAVDHHVQRRPVRRRGQRQGAADRG